MKFEVAVPRGGTEGVHADEWSLEGGALVFKEWRGEYNPSKLVIAYAPGAWTAFWEGES